MIKIVVNERTTLSSQLSAIELDLYTVLLGSKEMLFFKGFLLVLANRFIIPNFYQKRMHHTKM